MEKLTLSMADVTEDLEAAHRGELRFAELLLRLDGSDSEDGQERGRTAERLDGGGGKGAALIATCDEVSRRKYRTALRCERLLRTDDDFAMLVNAVCQILEHEVDHRVSRRARPLGNELLVAAASGFSDDSTEVLDEWLKGRVPSTMAVHRLVLAALRLGADARRLKSRQFVDRSFKRPYQQMLASGSLEQMLDSARSRYRNPASHGERCFEGDEYHRCVRLLLGNDSLRAWHADGGSLDAPAEGILHHHLRLAPRTE